MGISSIFMFLIVGAIAGWLAGILMRGGGFGLLRNMLLGIIGAFVGGWLFNLVGIYAYGFIGSLITAVAGASLLLFVVGLFRK